MVICFILILTFQAVSISLSNLQLMNVNILDKYDRAV